MSRPRTSFDVTREEMAALRALAAELGFFIRRGPGTGELGNITQLLAHLAAAYRRDPKGVVAALGALFAEPGAGALPPPPEERGRLDRT